VPKLQLLSGVTVRAPPPTGSTGIGTTGGPGSFLADGKGDASALGDILTGGDIVTWPAGILVSNTRAGAPLEGVECRKIAVGADMIRMAWFAATLACGPPAYVTSTSDSPPVETLEPPELPPLLLLVAHGLWGMSTKVPSTCMGRKRPSLTWSHPSPA
jgi:hypothetical protein